MYGVILDGVIQGFDTVSVCWFFISTLLLVDNVRLL